MSHALADVVHVYLSTGCLHGQHDYCNAPQRPDGTGKRAAECKFCGAPCRCPCHGTTTAALSYDTESTTAAVLHAVDNLTDGYPALIPAGQLADDDTRPVRRCDATGNTIRGPVVPVELGGRRMWLCRPCFAAYRRSVAHLDDPLPLSEGPAL